MAASSKPQSLEEQKKSLFSVKVTPPADKAVDPSATAPASDGKPLTDCMLITIMGARGLAGKDKDQMSDPFCSVKVGTQTFKTAAIQRSLAPRWNETFRYEMKEACPDVYITIWDEKTKLFMGECIINLEPFKDVPVQLAKEHWYPIKGKKTQVHTTDVKKLEKI